MKNVVRIVMLALIVAAVYFTVNFLLQTNEVYEASVTDQEAVSDSKTQTDMVEEKESGEKETESSGEVILPETLPEDLEKKEEAASKFDNSGEIQIEETAHTETEQMREE